MKTVKIAVVKHFEASGYDWHSAYVVPDDLMPDIYKQRDCLTLKPRTLISDWQMYLGTREYRLRDGYTVGLDQAESPSIFDNEGKLCGIVPERNGSGWNVCLLDDTFPRPLKATKDENQVWKEAIAQDV